MNLVGWNLSFLRPPAVAELTALLTSLRDLGAAAEVGRQNAVVFETEQCDGEIHHRLLCRPVHRQQIGHLLTTAVPDVRIEPYEVVDSDVGERWSGAIELRVSKKDRSRVSEPASVSNQLLATMALVEPAERLLLQWVLAPLPMPPVGLMKKGARFEVDLRQVEARTVYVGPPVLGAVGRIAVVTKNARRDRYLLKQALVAMRPTGGRGSHPKRRRGVKQFAARRVERRTGPRWSWPAMLSGVQAAGFVGWPLAAPALED